MCKLEKKKSYEYCLCVNDKMELEFYQILWAARKTVAQTIAQNQ